MSKDNESMIITIPPDLGTSDDQINFQQRGTVQVQIRNLDQSTLDALKQMCVKNVNLTQLIHNNEEASNQAVANTNDSQMSSGVNSQGPFSSANELAKFI